MTPALSDDLKIRIVSWYFEEGLTYREICDRASSERIPREDLQATMSTMINSQKRRRTSNWSHTNMSLILNRRNRASKGAAPNSWTSWGKGTFYSFFNIGEAGRNSKKCTSRDNGYPILNLLGSRLRQDGGATRSAIQVIWMSEVGSEHWENDKLVKHRARIPIDRPSIGSGTSVGRHEGARYVKSVNTADER